MVVFFIKTASIKLEIYPKLKPTHDSWEISAIESGSGCIDLDLGKHLDITQNLHLLIDATMESLATLKNFPDIISVELILKLMAPHQNQWRPYEKKYIIFALYGFFSILTYALGVGSRMIPSSL